MKIRESGMPEELLWETFFRPDDVLKRLGLSDSADDVVEFGCGYGTFTIPAADRTTGVVYTFDIDPAMVALVQNKAASRRLANVQAAVRDFVAQGTGLAEGSAGYAMLFNILHAELPQALLSEARRVLAPGGTLGVMHWNYDPATPRGPSMEIRPRPEQLVEWVEQAGFTTGPVIDLPPYHYGFTARK